MARKKKEIKEFIPSKYQEAIFKYIGGASGHLVVSAAAGSGKSSTLIKSLEFIPSDKKILLSAFNRDIVSELKKKTKGINNVDVMTLHGLGLSMLKRNYPSNSFIPEPFKYESHIKNNIKLYTSINTYSLSGRNYFKYLDNIKKYVDFGRFYLCQTPKELDFIEARYGIETIADEKDVAIKVMNWGKTELDSVDYTDMIWLPHVLYLKPIGLLYDFIMIDECQDLNKAERELVLKCFKMGTRLVAVGDENQSIYSFSGADPESFNILKSLPNTECLPLSISYRCPKNVVEFAQKLVPSIEYNENNKNLGEVKYNVPLSDIEDGDMILCRNNAPLIQVYNEFLKLGKKAFIRGKDIGTNLKTLVKSIRQEKINADCREDGLFVRLYDDLFVTRNNIMERSAIDAKTAMTSPIIENKLDMIKALEILSEGLNTTDELIAKIDDIFPKRDKKDGISLSTIHKAKGLEANNVYIACNSLMPSSSAKKDWEILQEHNLIYVAYTRAKNILGFIDEKDFKDFDLKNTSSQAKLDRIETQVNRILGKTTKIIINENTAKVIIDNAQKIDLKEIKPARNITNINSKRTINSFSDLFMNKKQVKIKR
jgi:superfamily I DNA/RNA helicase